MRGLSAQDMKRFVQDHLRPDGVLLIHFMRRHIGGRVTYDLLNELMRLYWIRVSAHSGCDALSIANLEVTPTLALPSRCKERDSVVRETAAAARR